MFFLQIGIDADVTSFGSGEVLRDASILLVVAVVGKLLSPLGAIGAPGDKPLIGLGMLPRGEVGLIFATIGLQNGVLGDDLYAALLLVVLVTTLVTPQLLKARYHRLRAAAKPVGTPSDTPPPEGGWLQVGADDVGLAARPPTSWPFRSRSRPRSTSRAGDRPRTSSTGSPTPCPPRARGTPGSPRRSSM